jgi:adenine phosphoribosyltransferase
MALANYIRDIQGFEGILFKDITPLLIDLKATKECLVVSSLKDKKIQSHRGESRGFFGMMIARN